MAKCPRPRPRGCSRICLPICPQRYHNIIHSPVAFRHGLDQAFREHPERFPKAFVHGYTLKDDRVSVKRGLRLRRIECKRDGSAFRIRPSFVWPDMTAWADDASAPLFLPSFGVHFGALARVFGRTATFWYRLDMGLGRHRVVGTTVRQAAVPEHVVADEHHQTRDGKTCYLATTVAAGCCLGVALAPSASAEDLEVAYRVFQQEARNVQAD